MCFVKRRWGASGTALALILGSAATVNAAQTYTLFQWETGQFGGTSNTGTLTTGSTTITAGLTTAAQASQGTSAGFNQNFNSLTWYPAGLTLNNPPASYNSVGLGFDSGGSTQTISFTGGTVTDPILFINWGEPGLVATFDAGLTVTTLGSSSGVSRSGNAFTFDAASNIFEDGFAVRLTGTFSNISFVLSGASDSVTLGLANLDAAAVPGTGLAGLASIGLAGASRRRRR